MAVRSNIDQRHLLAPNKLAELKVLELTRSPNTKMWTLHEFLHYGWLIMVFTHLLCLAVSFAPVLLAPDNLPGSWSMSSPASALPELVVRLFVLLA